ncbi:MAG: HAD family hydrolase [Thermoplasmata archaeon]|nr:HAD family hydrolase [Thermoplasmata archaeon]
MSPRAPKRRRDLAGPARTGAKAPNRPEGLRGVLFDLDDTVFDHAHALTQALDGIRRSEPVLRKRSAEEIRRKYVELLDQFHRRVLNGELGESESRALRFQALFRWAGLPLKVNEARERAAEYRRQYLDHRRAVPGVAPLLTGLAKSARLGIVSNNPRRGQLDKLRAIGLADRFKVVMTSEEAGAAKPDPEIFQAALDKLGVARDEAVMVGDSWAADVLGARAAGLVAVWFNRRRLPNPDPSLAVELTDYRPASDAMGMIYLAFRLEEE